MCFNVLPPHATLPCREACQRRTVDISTVTDNRYGRYIYSAVVQSIEGPDIDIKLDNLLLTTVIITLQQEINFCFKYN